MYALGYISLSEHNKVRDQLKKSQEQIEQDSYKIQHMEREVKLKDNELNLMRQQVKRCQEQESNMRIALDLVTLAEPWNMLMDEALKKHTLLPSSTPNHSLDDVKQAFIDTRKQVFIAHTIITEELHSTVKISETDSIILINLLGRFFLKDEDCFFRSDLLLASSKQVKDKVVDYFFGQLREMVSRQFLRGALDDCILASIEYFRTMSLSGLVLDIIDCQKNEEYNPEKHEARNPTMCVTVQDMLLPGLKTQNEIVVKCQVRTAVIHPAN